MTRTPTSNFCLDTKRDIAFSLKRTCESALVARPVVRRMTTSGSLITIRFQRGILNGRSSRRASTADSRLAIAASSRRLDDDGFTGIEHGGVAAFERLDAAVLAAHCVPSNLTVVTAGKPEG